MNQPTRKSWLVQNLRQLASAKPDLPPKTGPAEVKNSSRAGGPGKILSEEAKTILSGLGYLQVVYGRCGFRQEEEGSRNLQGASVSAEMVKDVIKIL